jgi:hypothetical protein
VDYALDGSSDVEMTECGGMVLPEGLLSAIEGSSIPLQRLFVLSLVVKYQGYVVDGIESGGMAVPEGPLVALEVPL